MEKRYAAAWLCSLFAAVVMFALPMAAFADEDPAPADVPEATAAAVDASGAAADPGVSAAEEARDDAPAAEAGASGDTAEAGDDAAEPATDPEPATEPAGDPSPSAEPADVPRDAPAPADEPADDGIADGASQGAPSGEPDAEPAAPAAEPAAPAATATKAASTTESTASASKAASAPAKGASAASGKKAASTTAKTAVTKKAATATAAKATKKAAKKAKVVKKAKKASAKGGPVTNGTYVLNLAKSSKLMLSVMKAKGAAKAVFKTDDNSIKQRWVLTWAKKQKAYTIKNAGSKLFLTTNSTKAGKELVWQKAKNGTSKMQLWKLSKSGEAFRILSAANPSIGLGTWSGELKDGYYATVQSKAANKYLFYLVPAGNDASKRPAKVKADIDVRKTYSIKLAAKKSLAAGIKDASQDNNAQAALGASDNSGSQKWRFYRVGKGLYQVVDVNTNKALAMKGGLRGVGTEVVQVKRNKSNQAQQWWIGESKDGSVTFTNRLNGLVVKAAKAKDGAGLKAGLPTAAAATRKYKVSETDLVSSGYYTITQDAKRTKALSTPAKVSSGKTQLKVTTLDRNLDQKYRITRNAAGQVRVFSVLSGTYLADNGKGKGVLAKKKDSDAQLWTPLWNGSSISLKNVATGKVLGVSGTGTVASLSKPAANTGLVLNKGNLIEDGVYYIGALSGKAVMEVEGQSKKSGANVRLAKQEDAQSQKFTIKHIGGDLYKVASAYSKHALSVAGTSNGANVNQKKYLGANTQKWIVKVSEKGGLQFVNKASGKAVSVGKAKAGANVTAKTNAQTSKQRWTLLATTAYDDVQMRSLGYAERHDSSSNKYVTVDKIAHRVIVWTRDSKDGKWKLKFDWPCIVGKPSTPTPEGNFKFTGGYYTNADPHHDCFSAYYYRHIHAGTYFHTLLKRPYSGPNGPVIHGNKFGTNVSGGCTRLATENAKWIYSRKNIPRGTGLSVYSY